MADYAFLFMVAALVIIVVSVYLLMGGQDPE